MKDVVVIEGITLDGEIAKAYNRLLAMSTHKDCGIKPKKMNELIFKKGLQFIIEGFLEEVALFEIKKML